MFPEVIDNTMRVAFTNCGEKFRQEFIECLSPKGSSVHLTAGRALAKGNEAFRKIYYTPGPYAGNYSLALHVGFVALTVEYGYNEEWEIDPDFKNTNKSWHNTVLAYHSFWQKYHPEHDHLKPAMITSSSPGIEFSFLLPIDILHPQTGNPILYSGRFDQIADFHGMIFAEDDKTTTSLGASWSGKWGLRSQFTGYAWGARQHGIDIQGTIIRGIGMLKTSITHAEAIIYHPQWMIDRWYIQLLRDVRRMINSYEQDEWDFALSDTCNDYGGCPFKRLCESPNPENWIEGYYIKSIWDPTKGERIEIPLSMPEKESLK